jgi:hypothetical protein
MDALRFFHLRYDDIHTITTDRYFKDLSDEQWRQRPHGLNSIAWLLWHLARCEDVGVNRFVVDRPQVLDTGEWAHRMRVLRRDIGTRMTSSEVDELSSQVDIPALLAYWSAVGERTMEVTREIPVTYLDTPVDPEHIRRLVSEEGVAGPYATGLEAMWLSKPNRGWFLAQLALTHHWSHLGDVSIVRGCLGLSLDR